MRAFRNLIVAAVAAVALAAPTARAASTFSQVLVGEGDGRTFDDGTFRQSFTVGETLSATDTFTHVTPTGTQSYTGSASATTNYQRLKAETSATLSNTYRDPTYESGNGGVPTDYDTLAISRFDEKLQYGGTATNYLSTYRLRLTGTLLRDGSPDDESDGNGGTTFLGAQLTIRLQHGNRNEQQLYSIREAGNYSIDLISQTFVHDASPQNFFLEIITNSRFSTTGVPDGSTVSGAANFGNTLELIGVDLRDAATGAFLANETVSRESGGTLAVVMTPEPTSAAGIVAIALVGLKRRRGAR